MDEEVLFRPLNVSNGEPLYRQLQDNLRDAVAESGSTPNTALPTEREIADRLGVSRVTVRKAVEGLVEDGLLVRRQGAGTFVAERIVKDATGISSFTEDVEARGLTPSSRWIGVRRAQASGDEALALGLSPGTAVFRVHRIRMANDEPLAVEYSTIPAAALNDQSPESGSLYDALQACGHRPVRALQRLRAVSFSSDIATQLNIPTGSAGLFIERRGFLKSGKAVELTESYYRGDAYDFVSEIDISAEHDLLQS